MTDGLYITRADTAQILLRERTVPLAERKAENRSPQIDFDGTLDQINQEIICHILEEENGNQSRTARRLGISRTTLWRLLNR